MPGAEAEALRQAVSDLAVGVDNLAGKLELQENEVKKSKRKTFWLAVSVVLDVILSVVLFVFQNRITDNQEEIRALQSEQEISSSVNRHSQCAFMELFFPSEQASKNSPSKTQEERDAASEAYLKIHDIYDNLLKCQDLK